MPVQAWVICSQSCEAERTQEPPQYSLHGAQLGPGAGVIRRGEDGIGSTRGGQAPQKLLCLCLE